MILTFRPALRSEAEWISGRLREEDRQEVLTASGKAPEEVLPVSFDLSRECYTIRLCGKDGRVESDPTVIFGIADDPHHAGMGVVWLLATDNIRRGALSILREGVLWLDHFNRLYPNGIHNIVDIRNDLHVRWLTLAGFKFVNEISHNGHTFIYFQRHTNV
jgi:hypothetical protein